MMKKVKKLTISKAKEAAWRVFSLFIRTRDSHNGIVTCFTCQFNFLIKETQAGHFIQGRHNSVLFDERNVHAQCRGCNIFKSGNLIEYYPRMVEMYGGGVIEELKFLDTKHKQFKVYELIEIKEKYEKKLKDMIE